MLSVGRPNSVHTTRLFFCPPCHRLVKGEQLRKCELITSRLSKNGLRERVMLIVVIWRHLAKWHRTAARVKQNTGSWPVRRRRKAGVGRAAGVGYWCALLAIASRQRRRRRRNALLPRDVLCAIVAPTWRCLPSVAVIKHASCLPSTVA